MPCASSLAVVVMTGTNQDIYSIIHFILVYVLGIALVLFLIVTTFSFTRNIFFEKITSIEKKINLDIMSGLLIIFVGFVYLSYNWVGHIH